MARTIGPVEREVRRHCSNGTVLDTPSKQSDFITSELNESGIRIDKIGVQYITWESLEGVVPYLQDLGGTVKIGAVMSANVEPNTLESYMRDCIGVNIMTGTYVAAILENAHVVEYTKVRGSNAMYVRLAQPFMEQSP